MKSVCFIQSLVLVFFLSLAFFLPGPEAKEEVSLEMANRAFDRQEFAEAARLYSTLIKRQGMSANILYNLANSYAQMGQTGKAVVNYHRAIRLSPNDPDINRNLTLTLERAGLYDQEKPVYEKIADQLSLDQWSYLSLIFLITVMGMYSGWLFSHQKKLLFRNGGLFLLPLLLLASFFTITSYQNHGAAIIIGADNPLRISPFKNAASTGSIQEGRMVKVLSRHGQYLLIEDGVPRSGWVPISSVESIIHPTLSGTQ